MKTAVDQKKYQQEQCHVKIPLSASCGGGPVAVHFILPTARRIHRTISNPSRNAFPIARGTFIMLHRTPQPGLPMTHIQNAVRCCVV